MFLLEINDLSCSVRMGSHLTWRRKRKQVLRNICFSIEEGSTFGLLGASGSGKTTLAKCISGLTKPDHGSIIVCGLSVFPALENRARVGLDIQMLFQGGGVSLDPTMKVGDSIIEGITARNGKIAAIEISGTAEKLLSSVGLDTDVLEEYPGHLSGGQRQRIAIARALSAEPRLLILDEPTSALDMLTQAQVLSLLKSLQHQRGFSILYITHDVATAFAFCDTMALLHGGTIIEVGSTKEILEQPKHEHTKWLLAQSRLVLPNGG